MKKTVLIFMLVIIMLVSCSCSNVSGGPGKETADTTDPIVTVPPFTDITDDGTNGLAENDIKADDETVIVRAACAYPVVEYENSEIADKINAAIKKKAEDFVLRADSCRALAQDYYDSYDGDAESFTPYSLIGTCEITLFNGEYLSVLFSFTEITGGFHANDSIAGMTFTLSDGEQAELDGVLNLDEEAVINLVSSRFTAMISSDPESYYPDAAETVSGYVDMTMFYMAEEGVTVYLPLYSVAPFTTGIPKILVPYGDIAVLEQN